MERIYELKDLLSNLDQAHDYSLQFHNTKSIIAGIIRLHPGENDYQEPHSLDEIYYIIEGDGYIEINHQNHPIKKGAVIFIPANAQHRFIENKKVLVILYVFAGLRE